MTGFNEDDGCLMSRATTGLNAKRERERETDERVSAWTGRREKNGALVGNERQTMQVVSHTKACTARAPIVDVPTNRTQCRAGPLPAGCPAKRYHELLGTKKLGITTTPRVTAGQAHLHDLD